jgi:poly-gamma-glutamate synthase PgsB/CapB
MKEFAMGLLAFYLLLLAVLLGALFVEAKHHRQNLKHFTLRVHVNGTRGKSSVTRLIAAGLRAGGRKVVAKTTGTEAKIIHPDGTEEPLKRRGPANIKEYIAVEAKAAKMGADTLVFECMALRPDLQKFCEERLLKSTIGVITNVRADHEDIMGPDLPSIAKALSNTIPQDGTLVTTPEAAELLKPFLNGAKGEHVFVPVGKPDTLSVQETQIGGETFVCGARQVVVVSAQDLQPQWLEGFTYNVIPENLALALSVCRLAGIDTQVALEGMRKALPDAGNLQITNMETNQGSIRVINALAANDPDSTDMLWKMYVKDEQVAVLLNCRKDRKLRTVQLCKLLGAKSVRAFIIAGDTIFAKETLSKTGYPAENIYTLPEEATVQDLIDILQPLQEDKLTLFAAGNIKGLSDEFRNELSAEA